MAGHRIIVVDNESYVAATLATRLRKAGHEVRTAGDGQEAMDLALSDPPDAIITDFQMPILNGYEMAVKLKNEARTANVPLVMLTGRGHLLSEQELALTNIKQLIPKPFSALELIAKVEALWAPTSA